MIKFEYRLGDYVEMQKYHPCNNRTKIFKIIRMGADIKIKCTGCGNILMMSRLDFEKRIKRVLGPTI